LGICNKSATVYTTYAHNLTISPDPYIEVFTSSDDDDDDDDDDGVGTLGMTTVLVS